ncbi:hypothetical protein [Parachryseolinea silvisoli]|jgi:hypothetical protein|uniref:hypothetical protein n=1 Tax=Parachryseolinea silvisoli TaxID=2873601 RepID=UPI002265CD00|nr:hypothetical protein [Parachryseolinea silvisoli]MCD9016804.1 hypothetical protein [Parachryseolinea silvisoli]
MFRFLLIIGIISYVFYKIGSFFFRAGAAAQQLKNYKNQQKDADSYKKTKKRGVKGGDYVDYEEIK